MKRYSLADYRVSIDSNDPTIKSMFGTISIGGEGSYLGSIGVSQNSNLWNTKGFATGAWAHDKNLDRTGKCQIQLHQLSNDVVKLIRLFNVFYSGNYGSSTIVVSDNLGNKIASHTIPIRPGRNLALICESAAVNHRQKKMGYNAAQELYKRVQESLAKRRDEELE